MTLVIKKGLVVTIRESTPEKMIHNLCESIKGIKESGIITDMNMQAMKEFVGTMRKIAETI